MRSSSSTSVTSAARSAYVADAVIVISSLLFSIVVTASPEGSYRKGLNTLFCRIVSHSVFKYFVPVVAGAILKAVMLCKKNTHCNCCIIITLLRFFALLRNFPSVHHAFVVPLAQSLELYVGYFVCSLLPAMFCGVLRLAFDWRVCGPTCVY